MRERELKFRAWDTKANKMSDAFALFGEFTLLGAVHVWQAESDVEGDSLIRLNDLVIMQYTGLKDKNGREIYEGDIVKKKDPKYWHESIGEDEPDPPDAEDINFYRGGTAQVVAVEFGYYMQEIDCGEWCFNGPEGREWSGFEIEVIGNIFENPELTFQATPPNHNLDDK